MCEEELLGKCKTILHDINYFADSFFRLVEVAAWSCWRLFSSWNLPHINMAHTSSSKDFYICVETTSWQITNKSKLGVLRHYLSRYLLLCVRLWRCWISSPPFSFMQQFWFSFDVSLFMDWVSVSRSTIVFKSFYSVYLSDMWFESVALIFTIYLTHLCLSCVEWT